MDQLPVELQEKILKNFLWDNIKDLYRARAVSKSWKSAIDGYTSKLFKVWYSRCKAEIPPKHLMDIVQAKYPLVAHPWQQFYWVDTCLPHVAKNAYEIWKNFPNFDEKLDDTKIKYNSKLENDSKRCAAGMTDKYFGRTCYRRDDNDDKSWITEIYQWDNEDYYRKYDIESYHIDFYTTDKGTFVVLRSYQDGGRKNYISKYPIDNLDLPSELILLGRNEEYRITQNECFLVVDRDGSRPNIVEHGIITESGFQTSTIIKPPAEIVPYEWDHVRIEICGSTLYIVHVFRFLYGMYRPSLESDRNVNIAKYKIARNSNGKLSFTFDDMIVVKEYNKKEHNIMYSYIVQLFYYDLYPENLCLTDNAFAVEKFNPWLRASFDRKIKAMAVHANFVICEEQAPEETRVCIFKKDNLTECIEANDVGHLKPPLKIKFPWKTELYWIGIIYIGSKAQLLVQHYDHKLCRISFY